MHVLCKAHHKDLEVNYEIMPAHVHVHVHV